MKLGFVIHLDLRGKPFAEVAGWASAAGFQGVEARDLSDATLEACKRTGLEIGAFSVSHDLMADDPAARDKAVADFERNIDRAAEVGVGTIVTLARTLTRKAKPAADFPVVVESLRRVVAHAE